MAVKITKWLMLIIGFKLVTVLVVAQFYDDPRRDVDAREKLCNAFKPNTVFIGTSRTLYGIDPTLFDSLNDHQTRSYNFGVFSISPQASFQIADQMITNDPAIQTIYIELSALDYSTVALKPQFIFHDAVFRAAVMAGNSNIALSDKLNSFLLGLNTTLFQIFSIAPQITSIKKIIKPVSDPIEGSPDLRDDGHQSVDLALSQVNEHVLSNQTATQQMLSQESLPAPNTYYISRIKELIGRANGAGKKVVFFYPNNITTTEYLILSQVAPYLPEKNLIRLPKDHRLYDLFKPENLFDPHHLNQKGAAIYTRFLQSESTKKIHNL